MYWKTEMTAFMYLSTRLWNLKKKESFGFTENGKKNQRNVWRKRIRKENSIISTIPEETGEWLKTIIFVWTAVS